MTSAVRRLSLVLATALSSTVLSLSSLAAAPPRGSVLDSAERANPRTTRMSEMGARATLEVARLQQKKPGIASKATARVQALTGATSIEDAVQGARDDDECQNNPRCGRGFRDGPRGGQAEVSIAIDSTGQHIVVGFNDQRGFNLTPISVSGFMYSDDGGATFTDGGQLPAPDPDANGLPQVFGDPEVKYLGGCTFIYSSILIAENADVGFAQTMGVHRSTDCGHTWEGPFEVAAATYPFDLGADFADKEFMDVDPDTGRVMMTWTNFGNVVSILSAFSDDGGATWPDSSLRVIADSTEDGQSSVPRFAGNGSNNVYSVWRRFPFPGTLFGYGNTVGFARSLDNGDTWQAPINTSAEFLTQDMILGNDRSNTSPSLAVDNSNGPKQGNIYLVYPNNDNSDGSDIVFQRSTDQGQTFSAPLVLNSRPGADRPQWFPWVTVDSLTGRVSVFYYDQGIASSGDLSEVTYTFSKNGGQSWSKPRPLTFKPFHAGHNNDTGQPNLGDYNQAVSQNGTLYSAFALANRPPLGFVDGLPDTTLTGIDATLRKVGVLEHLVDYASLSIGNVSFSDSGGNGSIDPGETANLTVPLFNYVTNPLNRGRVRSPLVGLVSDTAGVTVLRSLSTYGTIQPGATRSNNQTYRIRLSNSFVPGTTVDLRLLVGSLDGVATLPLSLDTGSPAPTTLLTENFDGVAPGSLPAGWTAANGAGALPVPWTTSNTFCGGASNGAFQPNNDAGPSLTRWQRLISPFFDVPADASHVVVEFDVCYDTEDDPLLTGTAYDGFFLRVTDLTPGHTVRSVLAEAFTDEFATGNIAHYQSHLPRSSNPSYFEDMSVWGGDSGGIRHVRMRLPGMQGSRGQLRFEYTQDSIFNCQDVRPASPACGVFVDNVVVKSVKAVDQP